MAGLAGLLSDAAAGASDALWRLSERLRPAAAVPLLAAAPSAPPGRLAVALERVQQRWEAVDPDTRRMLVGFCLSVLSGVILMRQAKTLLADSMSQLESPPDERTDQRFESLSDRRLLAIARRLRARGYTFAHLNGHERRLLADVVLPSDVDVGFADVGGQPAAVGLLQTHVVAPLRFPDLYAHSAIAQRPAGVLLHGPPGCGKTMLAKAVAAEGGGTLISISPSSLEHKYVGETPKAVAAVFSLARKLAPAVVFIDEVDGLLGARADGEQAWSLGLKSALLQHWDGLQAQADIGAAVPSSDGAAATARRRPAPWVVVVGATNRPWALDEAALRRMPRQVAVGLPDAAGRTDILRRLLARERCAPDVAAGGAGFAAVAAATAGCSGSDLAEVVREAVQAPINEAFAARVRQEFDAAQRRAGSGVRRRRPAAPAAPFEPDAAEASADACVDIDEEGVLEAVGRDGGGDDGDDDGMPSGPPPPPAPIRVRPLTVDDLLRAAARVKPSRSIAEAGATSTAAGAGGARSGAGGSDDVFSHVPSPAQLPEFLVAALRAMAAVNANGSL
jgi:SpoVK/Ycf46/Vps4 family AAA+-type ATPase